MEYILTADSLCKYYRHFKALNEFSIHVPKGSIYGFIGKNGAGKTTLHCTAGRIPSTALPSAADGWVLSLRRRLSIWI